MKLTAASSHPVDLFDLKVILPQMRKFFRFHDTTSPALSHKSNMHVRRLLTPQKYYPIIY